MSPYWNFLVAQTPLSPEQTFLFLVVFVGAFTGVVLMVDHLIGKLRDQQSTELQQQREAEWHASQVRYLAKARAHAISHDRTIGVIYEGLDDQIRRRELETWVRIPVRH